MQETEYLIIGGGPTGLGAACRLEEKGLDWHLLEATEGFGGLAGSHRDARGFTWDNGGHVQFSHYETFDRYMDLALGADGWVSHQRESWVWIRNRFVPYPFQNNLHRLDAPDRWRCVKGLLEAAQKSEVRGQRSEGAADKPANFEAWMLATFGEGVTDLFMRPYNFKVWAFPPPDMDYTWIGERVAVPPLDRVLKSICTGEDEVSWGPNSLFRFPLRGGTGAVWSAIGSRLPPSRVSLGTPVENIDAAGRTLRTAGGSTWRYRHLISTMPLDRLVHMTLGVVSPGMTQGMKFSGTNVVGVGMRGETPPHLKTKCWMYFPESNSPYYRVTVFSNYSPHNVPEPGRQWSLMTETAESPAKPVARDELAESTIRALVEDGLLPDRDQIVSTYQYHLRQGYPTPFLGRDTLIGPVLRAFEAKSIYSRGRFGAWKYEVANQDHSFAQGYECVERLAAGGGPELEPTLHTPGVVNNRRNP